VLECKNCSNIPMLSTPAFSTPCHLVPPFPVPCFQPLHFRWCRVFHSRVFSRPPALRLCVCRSERKVYCGKTADWIRMSFGMVSGVGRMIGVLDGRGKHQKERGRFGGEFGASHCPVRTLLRSCAKYVNQSSCRLGW